MANSNDNSRVYWSDEVINFLIGSIRNAPYMWDKSNKDYSTRYLKHNFWKNLRWTLLKRFKFRAYTNELTRKWHNLTSYYRVQQKAIVDANARGAPPEEMRALEGWKFLHQLQFLPYSLHDKSTENAYDCNTWDDSDARSSMATGEDNQYGNNPESLFTPKVELRLRDPKKFAIEEFNVPAINEPEVEEITPISLEPRIAMDNTHNSPNFHYGMAFAQDIYELDDNLKIDAKLEIMKVFVKYQKLQLHQTVMSLADSKKVNTRVIEFLGT
ncbi:uncharacterized protein LOC108601270 [Drosophila busckii]|uniref:uncharacterized protein LOC108601270 n=1 Tax=Drosophila busckii TaxID=30019 RepID=UPI00083F21D1|nr:uncharacterized protein LOC108601270 [Drosophila busckii]